MLPTSQQPCEVGTFISPPSTVRKLRLKKVKCFPSQTASKLVVELRFEPTNTYALIHWAPPSRTDCREVSPADFSFIFWLVTSWLPSLAFDKYGHLKAPKKMAFWRQLVVQAARSGRCPQCPHGNEGCFEASDANLCPIRTTGRKGSFCTPSYPWKHSHQFFQGF